MKKLLTLTVAAAMSLSLAACGESYEKETNPTETMPVWAQDPEERPTEQETVPELTEALPALPEETEAPTVAAREDPYEMTAPAETESEVTEETVPPTTAPRYEMEEKFDPADETVYAIKRVNIRSQGNVNSVALAKLETGIPVKRVGISQDGWSAIVYDGKVCYVASEYLSTDESPEPTENPNVPNEREVDDMVYTIDDVNMREGPGFDRAILCRVPEFVDLHRTGIVSSGWCKVTYKDQVGYINTGYLAEKHPGQSDTVYEEETNDTVYTTREVNLRKQPGTDKAIVGRIPEGTELTRTAVTETGWGKVSYNGTVGYVSGDYLTTDAP